RRDKGAKAYFDILSRVIHEIGEEAAVGVVMDNAATCVAAGQMIEAEFKHIFSVPCTAHNIDLIFEQFGKIGWVDIVLKKAAEVVNFFMNHTKDLYLPLQTCLTDKDWKESIVLPGQRHLFPAATATILDNDFRVGAEKVQKTSAQLLDLLKLSDGIGPTIGNIYGRMDEAVESLRKQDCLTELEKEELEEIIMRRWNTMTSLLHCAAMFLDPEFRDSSLDKDPEVMDGFWTWLYSWAKLSAYRELDKKVNCWIEGTGKFKSARKTVTCERAERYISARAEVRALNVKAPAKRAVGQPRKVAQVQDTAADVMLVAEDGEASQQGSKQGAAAEVAAKGPAERGKGRPWKASPPKEMQVEAGEPEEEGKTSRKGIPEAEEG
ncbi:hypothetical protein CBR_g8499, partial [Chara braunii]